MTFFHKHPFIAGVTSMAMVVAMLGVAGAVADAFHLAFGWALGIVLVCWSAVCFLAERVVRLIMGKRQIHPTPEDVEELSAMLRQMTENFQQTCKEASEFKPGDLEPEEEKLVKREGLNRLNYVPKKALQRQAEALQRHEELMRKRAEVMSRPSTDPERRQMERRESAERHLQSLKDRFDGFGYGMFLLVILGLTAPIAKSHGWTMGIFCCLLMVVILELSYRLYAGH